MRAVILLYITGIVLVCCVPKTEEVTKLLGPGSVCTYNGDQTFTCVKEGLKYTCVYDPHTDQNACALDRGCR